MQSREVYLIVIVLIAVSAPTGMASTNAETVMNRTIKWRELFFIKLVSFLVFFVIVCHLNDLYNYYITNCRLVYDKYFVFFVFCKYIDYNRIKEKPNRSF